MGHTVGLRHNFQGSYDSINYHDEYWLLREENLDDVDNLADFYRVNQVTTAQEAGEMRQFQYSSMMDYGYSWHSDLKGLGKYDQAAFVFGYTAGTYTPCSAPPCTSAEPGFVEIFQKDSSALGEAGTMLTKVESGYTLDDPGLPSISLLERFHYTTFAQALPSLDELRSTARVWMKYREYEAQRKRADELGTGRFVRVPYMFCSDEWETSLVSCRAFDQGADPSR